MGKKKKRKKLKIKSVLLVFLFLILLGVIFFLLSLIKVKTFIIKNNKYLTDEEVLKELNLDDNSSFLLTNSLLMSDDIKDSKLIKDIDFSRNMYLEVTLNVTEYKMLYYNQNTKKVMLENEEEIDYKSDNLPVLTNKIEDKEVLKQFNKKMAKVNLETLNMISEITYSPNGIDKERFLFSMNDGNYVFLTITKLTKINDYKKIVESMEDRKGILYLDYGNYFVPKE